MGWRGTAILALALAIATIYAWYDVSSEPHDVTERTFLDGDRRPAPGDDIKRLLDVAPADVVAVRLQRGDFDARVARSGAGWNGIQRSQALDDFVANVAELAEIAQLDIQPEERRDYGLEPPVGVIELERASAPPIILLVGSHNPPSTAAYVQLDKNGPVMLTGAVLLWELDKAIRAVRDSAPAPQTRPAEGATASATVIDHSGKWESGYGETFFNIVGTVKNAGTHPLRWIRLRADLLDKEGQVVTGADCYNYRAEGLGRDDLPADMLEKVRIVAPKPVPAGGDDRFRISFLKDETPPFDSYRVFVVQVQQE